jgi:hypothetical protein
MFESYFQKTCVELIQEERNPDSPSVKVLFRVLNNDAWGAALLRLLQEADGEDEYVIAIRKEYYLEAQVPKFVWNLTVWGENWEAVEDAAIALGTIIFNSSISALSHSTTVVAPPPPPPKTEEVAPEPVSILAVSRVNSADGPRTITKVPLPFFSHIRVKPGDLVTRVGGPRGAYVEGVNG